MTDDPTTPEDRTAMLAMFPPAPGRAALPDPRWEDIADRMATPLDFRRQQEAHGSDCVCAMCVVLRDYIAAKSSPPAALPDERLREADRKAILEWAKFTRDESMGYWGKEQEAVYDLLLAAADREENTDV